MSDLLKKADMGKYPDDDWREILGANGFAPSGVSEEVWRKPTSSIQVMIDVDRETEEPFYQVITEDGTRSAPWTDTEALKSIVEPKDQEPEPPKLSPEDEQKGDEDFLKSMGIIGHQRTSKKFAGRPARFSFAVPTQAAATVAFHLAKAGMRDFEVEHFQEDEFSVFQFPNEPEMHVAEEIVKTEYADQIRSRKGLWGMWAETHDPTQENEKEFHPSYVASGKTALAIDDEGHPVEKPTKSYTDVGKDNREAVGNFAAAEEKPRPEITDDDLPEGFFSDKSFEEQRREKKKDPSWEPDYKKMPKSALLQSNLEGWPTWEPPAK